MRITSSAMAMASSYAATRAESTELQIKIPARTRQSPPPPPPPPPPAAAVEPKGAEPAGGDQQALPSDLKTWLLKLLVEWLTGKPIDDPQIDAQPQPTEQSPQPAAAAATSPSAAPQRAQPPSVELHYEHVRYESERANFEAAGVVTTGDGRQIALDLRVGMSREHYERLQVDVGTPQATDPLVLNFDAAATSLGGHRISFDLNLDGASDQVALPSTGSKFLAMDRNHNGRIDDGSELFGPASGNGFAELAALDGDGDGWIDEDDQAFSELRVWDGEGAPQTLAQAGVGAIYTAGAATPFTLGESDATATGFVRSTGVWLAESGGAHSVQQVDIVV